MESGEPAALDTNILVFAEDAASINHGRAADLLVRALKGEFPACLCPQVLGEFYAVVTGGAHEGRLLAANVAATRVHWLGSQRRIRKVYPKRFTHLRAAALCAKLGVRGSRFFDVYLACTLLDNGVRRLLTHNTRDFRGIPGLVCEDPFA